MKKNFYYILIFSTLFNISCTSQQKASIPENISTKNQKIQKIEKIELSEQTRGTNRIFTFTPTSKTVSINGESTRSNISLTEWEGLIAETSLISLSGISELESPTTARFTDAALSSTIQVVKDGETYTSSSFDAGRPPKQLESLYKKLQSNIGVVKKTRPKIN